MTWRFLTAGSFIPVELALAWLMQSTALLAVGLLAGRLLRKSGPALQSTIYRTTLAAVFLCPLASFALAGAGFNGILLRFSVETPRNSGGNAASAHSLSQNHPRGGDRSQWHDAQDRSPDHRGLPARAPDARHGEEPSTVRAAASRALSIAPVSPPSAEIAVAPSVIVPRLAWALAAFLGLWVFGSLALALRLLRDHLQVERLLSGATPAEPDVAAVCRGLARQMRLEAPTVLRSAFLSSPCLAGIHRPAILLPEEARDHLNETFLHELAHLARGDGFWNLARHVATALLWVQPLCWVLSRRLEVTAEEICDDYVVEFGADRAQYAGLLLELAERTMMPLAPAGLGMFSLRSFPARRIMRILDQSRRLSTRVGALAVAATLLAGLTGTILAGLIGVGNAEDDVRADAAVTKPQGGAVSAPPRQGTKESEKRLTNPPRQGTQESERRSTNDAAKVVPGTVKVPITGRIIDLEGRPVADVKVTLHNVDPARNNDLTPWLEAVRLGEPPWTAYKHLNGPANDPDENKPVEVTTDNQGRFVIDSIGPEKVVHLMVQGPTIAFTTISVVTRKIEPIAARGFPNSYGPGCQTIYGADFTFTAAPSRLVEGVVRDAKTQQPLAGVEVRSTRFAGSNFIGTKDLTAKTDAQGRFRLAGLPKGQGNRLLVVPSDEQPYFMKDAGAPDPPGLGPVSLDIDLDRGIWITGKVTDKSTGKPIEKAWMTYWPFLDNKFAPLTSVFHKDGNVDGVEYQDRYLSKADGTYRLVGLRGHAIVGANVHGGAYLAGAGSESIKGMNKHESFETYRNPIWPGRLFPTSMKEINASELDDQVEVNLELLTGASTRVQVTDREGHPIQGVDVRGRTGRGSWDREPMKEPSFLVINLFPKEERTVLFVHKETNQGKAIHLKEGDDKAGPLLVTLEPLARIAGRVLDPNGNPVSGATVRMDPQPGGNFSLHLGQVASDQQGRFVVPEVPIGCEYAGVVESRAHVTNQNHYAFFEAVKVRAGETTDIGEIRLKD
jgi:beta-lactamase regulating signal transducer with metallopeptidase domain/protocatechuate 3,4-dioxygenase beta subunit